MNRTSPSCRECGLCEVPRAEDLTAFVETVVREVIGSLGATRNRTVPVGVSARHMHLTQEHVEILFGASKKLTRLIQVPQPGELLANETVLVVGPKRRSLEVRILGPTRRRTQIELAYSDGIYLGVDLPHRLSGDIAGTAPLVLVGPEGVVDLQEGAIRAKRHIHVNPQDAQRLGVRNGQVVSVRTTGEMSVTFNNVVIREGEGLNLEMHLDTDEANAAGIRCGDPVELVEE